MRVHLAKQRDGFTLVILKKENSKEKALLNLQMDIVLVVIGKTVYKQDKELGLFKMDQHTLASSVTTSITEKVQ